MELSYRYSNYKQREIGAALGVDYNTVSQSRARLKTKLKSSRKLEKQLHRIQDKLTLCQFQRSDPSPFIMRFFIQT